MYIFLSRFVIIGSFFFLSPFTNYLSIRSMDEMPGCSYLISESRNPKTFYGFICLLESESISLRSSVKTGISFIERKRNTSMKTSYRQSYSTNTTTNNGNMWIIIYIYRQRLIGWDESRACTIITYAYVSFWPSW